MMMRANPPAPVMTVMIMPAVLMATMVDGRDDLALKSFQCGGAAIRRKGARGGKIKCTEAEDGGKNYAADHRV
jgi:hypothetical protein